MKYITTSAEMQKIDQMTIQKIGIPGMVLMEKAALKMHDIIQEKFGKEKKICIVAGIGNNGGDGLALGRLLLESGYSLTIQVVGNTLKASKQFEEQMKILLALGISIKSDVCYNDYDVIVDAVFGVGLSREVSGHYAEVLNSINQSKAYKIAVDAPSGICCTTGAVLGTAVRCDLTITFGLMKRGLLLYPGSDYVGEVMVADIGFPQQIISQYEPETITYTKEDLSRLPKRKNDSHKGTYGKVLIAAGAVNMAGACYFSAKAAYLCGSGLVEILTAEENRTILQTLIPEAVMITYQDEKEAVHLLRTHMKDCKTTVLGPGMGKNQITENFLTIMLKEYDGTLIIDADGCNLLSKVEHLLPEAKADIVITPHMKEASRILNMTIEDIASDSIAIIREYAYKNNLTFVLKNARTIISSGERLTFINSSGNNGMSTGGSGDVLSGMIAGLCSGGLKAKEGAKLGVYCHGLAGDCARAQKGAYSLMASDILNHISDILGGN